MPQGFRGFSFCPEMRFAANLVQLFLLGANKGRKYAPIIMNIFVFI